MNTNLQSTLFQQNWASLSTSEIIFLLQDSNVSSKDKIALAYYFLKSPHNLVHKTKQAFLLEWLENLLIRSHEKFLKFGKNISESTKKPLCLEMHCWNLLCELLEDRQILSSVTIVNVKLLHILPTVLEFYLFHHSQNMDLLSLTNHQEQEKRNSLQVVITFDKVFHLLVTNFSDVFKPSFEQYVTFLRALLKCSSTYLNSPNMDTKEVLQHLLHFVSETLKEACLLINNQQNQKKTFLLIVDKLLDEALRFRFYLQRYSLLIARSTIDLVDDFLSVGLFHPIHLSEFTLAYTVFRASNNESEVEFQLESKTKRQKTSSSGTYKGTKLFSYPKRLFDKLRQMIAETKDNDLWQRVTISAFPFLFEKFLKSMSTHGMLRNKTVVLTQQEKTKERKRKERSVISERFSEFTFVVELYSMIKSHLSLSTSNDIHKTLVSVRTMNKLLDLLIEYNVYQIQQDTSENDLYNFLHSYTTALIPFLSDQVHLLTTSQEQTIQLWECVFGSMRCMIQLNHNIVEPHLHQHLFSILWTLDTSSFSLLQNTVENSEFTKFSIVIFEIYSSLRQLDKLFSILFSTLQETQVKSFFPNIRFWKHYYRVVEQIPPFQLNAIWKLFSDHIQQVYANAYLRSSQLILTRSNSSNSQNVRLENFFYVVQLFVEFIDFIFVSETNFETILKLSSEVLDDVVAPLLNVLFEELFQNESESSFLFPTLYLFYSLRRLQTLIKNSYSSSLSQHKTDIINQQKNAKMISSELSMKNSPVLDDYNDIIPSLTPFFVFLNNSMTLESLYHRCAHFSTMLNFLLDLFVIERINELHTFLSVSQSVGPFITSFHSLSISQRCNTTSKLSFVDDSSLKKVTEELQNLCTLLINKLKRLQSNMKNDNGEINSLHHLVKWDGRIITVTNETTYNTAFVLSICKNVFVISRYVPQRDDLRVLLRFLLTHAAYPVRNKDLQIPSACRKCVLNAQFIEEPHIRDNFFIVICQEITHSIINDLVNSFQQQKQKQKQKRGVVSDYITSIAKSLNVLQEKDYQHEESIKQTAQSFDEFSSYLFNSLWSQPIRSFHINFNDDQKQKMLQLSNLLTFTTTLLKGVHFVPTTASSLLLLSSLLDCLLVLLLPTQPSSQESSTYQVIENLSSALRQLVISLLPTVQTFEIVSVYWILWSIFQFTFHEQYFLSHENFKLFDLSIELLKRYTSSLISQMSPSIESLERFQSLLHSLLTSPSLLDSSLIRKYVVIRIVSSVLKAIVSFFEEKENYCMMNKNRKKLFISTAHLSDNKRMKSFEVPLSISTLVNNIQHDFDSFHEAYTKQMKNSNSTTFNDLLIHSSAFLECKAHFMNFHRIEKSPFCLNPRKDGVIETTNTITILQSFYHIFSKTNPTTNSDILFVERLAKQNLIESLTSILRCLTVVTPPLTLKQFGLIYTMIYQLMLSNKGTEHEIQLFSVFSCLVQHLTKDWAHLLFEHMKSELHLNRTNDIISFIYATMNQNERALEKEGKRLFVAVESLKLILNNVPGSIRYQVINRHAIGLLTRLIPLINALTPPQSPWEEDLTISSFEIITKIVMDQFVKLKSRHIALILQSLTPFLSVEQFPMVKGQQNSDKTTNINNLNTTVTKDSIIRMAFSKTTQEKQQQQQQQQKLTTSLHNDFFMENESKERISQNLENKTIDLSNNSLTPVTTTFITLSSSFIEELVQEMESQSCIPQLREKQKKPFILSEKLFLAIYYMLYGCVKTRQYETFKVIAPFLEIIKYLFRQLIKIHTSTSQSATSIQCAQNLSRLLEEMSHNKVVMKKYTVYLILDFVQLVTREAIPTPLKEVLLNGIYSLLDICTDYECQQLFALLDEIGKGIFKALYTSYTRDHKFTGKI